jgi:hypothetical protein
MTSNSDMVKARGQANALPPQGAWLVFFSQVIIGASDMGLFILGSSAFIEEYVRTRQIPIPKLLHAFGVDLVFRYELSRAKLC